MPSQRLLKTRRKQSTGQCLHLKTGVVAWLTLVLLWLPVCSAQNNNTPPSLQTSDSKYYRVHSTAKPAEVAFVKKYMDMLFETYQQRFNEFKRRDKSTMDLYLFGSRQEYQQFVARLNMGAATTSGGMFFVDNENKGLAAYIEASDPDWTLQTLRHEGFHQFAYTFIGANLPLWVNEGLAEYFAEGIVTNGKIMPGIIPGRRLASLRMALETKTTLDFTQLISMTSPQWQFMMENRPDRGSMLYNQSWSMVQFLIHADNGRYTKAFAQYLRLISENMDSVKAFEQAFGTTEIEGFRNRWVEYLAGLQPDALSEALDELRFQAIGLRLLSEQKERIPTTAHQLKKVLQQGNFYIMLQGHGQDYRLESSDDNLFTYNLPGGDSKPYLLLEPSRSDLLPRISAPGLKPEPTINWARNSDGKLVFRIEFR